MIKLIPGWMKWAWMSCFMAFYFTAIAQHQELNERPGIWKNEGESRDTQKLIDIFKHGKVSGHFRSFLMQTQNKGVLKDDRALAMGGDLNLRPPSTMDSSLD
ncbi:MAG: hypothetical protein IPN73_18560 [Saprospiraceae bacterium]|nr:hypothetical protein [Saprospiraceae bacterium]